MDSKGQSYLKADDSNKADFEALGCHKHSRMPYLSIPEKIFNDPEILISWAKTSIDSFEVIWKVLEKLICWMLSTNEGDIYIVRRGINHRVSSTGECKILLIENKTTAHTGDVKSPLPEALINRNYLDK